MKNSSILIKAILFSFFFLNLCLLWSVSKQTKENIKMESIIQISNDSIQNLNNRYKILFTSYSIMFDYMYEKINSSIHLFDENNNEINITQLVNKKPKLIFKYSVLNCDVCVDEQITFLKRISEKIGSENIIILANYNSTRELSQFLRVNQINFKVLNLRDTEFTSVDKSVPYYFILDEGFSLKHFFVPIKEDTSLTQLYFDDVYRRYFQ